METSKGILIIALGHENYGRMAFNLAVSIKNNEPDMPIAIVHDAHTFDLLKGYPVDEYFDIKIECPEKYYTMGDKKVYLKAKTYVYDLSPFDKTLFLDADLIMLHHRKLEDLFEKLKDEEFSIACPFVHPLSTLTDADYTELSNWGDLKAAVEFYNIDTAKESYWQYHSEFIYFIKSKENKAYFDLARKLYINPKVPSVLFSNHFADEFSFSLASMIQSRYPKENLIPFFWQLREPKIRYHYDMEGYYAYSTAGNSYPTYVKENYDNLAKGHFKRASLQYPYLLTPKRSFLPERKML